MSIPEYMELDDAIYAVKNKMVCGMNEYWLDALSRWLPELKQLQEAHARLEKEADWLAMKLADEDTCPYLNNYAPEWCTCLDTPEDGFECHEDPKECWLKAAREAVEVSHE